MRILLTNDDGYFAEGLTKLALALCNEHDVVVSAPATEKSGAGHSLTFNRSLHFNTIGEDELLPWDHIDCGVSKEYLMRERAKALAAETTRDCRLGCNGCGWQGRANVGRCAREQD